MLTLLPLAVFAVVFLVILGENVRDLGVAADARDAFLKSAVIWGVIVTLVSEGLGVIHAIGLLWVAFLWMAFLLIALFLGLRRQTIRLGWLNLRQVVLRQISAEPLLLTAIAGVVLTLLIIALVSPPNSVDALYYHMPRVLHWAQDKSLQHYPTQYDPQVSMPIWSELAILNLRVLAGTDKLANLVQWFSMLGSLIVVSRMAALLGASRRAQILAVAFVVSIPFGILEATVVNSDYVTAFWSVGFAYFALVDNVRGLSQSERLAMASTLGLGMLTKPIFYVYALPVLIWYFAPRVLGPRRTGPVREALVIGLVSVAINLPYWVRNISTFGGPFGTGEYVVSNTWFFTGGQPRVEQDQLDDQDLLPEARSRLAWPANSIEDWLKRIAQAAGLNLVAPTSLMHTSLGNILAAFPGIFDEQYLAEQKYAAWSQEDTAGSPLHLFLVPLTLIALIGSFRRQKPLAFIYAFVVLSSFAILPIIIQHATERGLARYQLPFFVLWGPVVGIASLFTLRRAITLVGIALLLLSALPWLLFNNHRPVIGMPPWPTRTQSIFNESEVNLLVPMNLGLVDDYVSSVEVIQRTDCRRIGLMLAPDFLEYPFWRMMNAPESGIRFEVLNPTLHTQRYSDPTFEPCAIICTICEEALLRGLPRIGRYDSVDVYLARELMPTS